MSGADRCSGAGGSICRSGTAAITRSVPETLSTADDADLQVTITEVRPDGQEMYVQSGWLRASERALSPRATLLWPEHTHLREDARSLPAGRWEGVRVGVPGFGHVFRAGSRVRVSVDTPGGTRERH